MKNLLQYIVATGMVIGAGVGVIVLHLVGVVGFFVILVWCILWVLRSQGVL